MGTRKERYWSKSRRRIAKYASHISHDRVIIKINGKMRDLVEDYIAYLRKLDKKENLKYTSKNIKIYSKQWNQFRRKHITACHLKRILFWNERSPYLYKCITKYISGNNPNRGILLEGLILDILRKNGYTVKYINELWVHKYLPWLSCTSDGVIVNNDRFVAAVEIKTFTSSINFHNTIEITPDGKSLKQNTRIYFQVQAIAEIIDVPYVVFIYEFKGVVDKMLVDRDLDFIWRYHELIKERYFKHIIPFYLYGIPKNIDKNKKKKISYFSDNIYQRLMVVLEKRQEDYGYCEEDSFFHYYPDIKPSEVYNTYFEMFTDIEQITRLKHDPLLHNKLIDCL